MSVLPFEPRNVIVIDFGTVTECSDPSEVGLQKFFVSYVDNSGGGCGLYDTADYVLAAHEAKQLKADFEAASIIERFRFGSVRP